MAKNEKVNHYVNNEEFLNAMTEFRTKVKTAENSNSPRPRVPDYIGDCFIKIATHLSYKPNFINYTFRDDMISDGIENCLQYIDNFDPDKSKNPFAYFTQIIYYAFLRRIQKEKKQLYIKYRALERSGLMDEVDQQQSSGQSVKQPAMYDNIQEFIRSYEESMQKQKERANQKKKSKGLEKFAKEDAS
tara:strand:+ start:462 stop:1025 length:564 start_codon:yes stop_codon:yes gene_type:complete